MMMRRVLVILSSLAIGGCGSGIGQSPNAREQTIARCREVGTDADIISLMNVVRETHDLGYPRDQVLGVGYQACNESCWDHQCIAACADCVRMIVDLEY
ncbi:MAG: hypothetical protein HYT21_03250 [Candidatus Nealsonbacteria bacterium]|nr:hypothetical protein [Candidatus Nealsonbacteria bacterium]